MIKLALAFGLGYLFHKYQPIAIAWIKKGWALLKKLFTKEQ